MLVMILTWSDFITLVSRPPNSLWFIFLICLLVSLVSTFLNKTLVDHNKARRIQEVVAEHNAKKKALLELSKTNPKRYAKEYGKWQRRDASVQKMQQSIQMEKLKPTCITIIPFMAFFFVIRSIYTPSWSSIQLPVARPPINPMDDFPAFIVTMMRSQLFSAVGNLPVEAGFLGYTGWYMLCSFALGTVLQKLLGVSQSTQGQASSLFDSSSTIELPKPSDLL
ncbi:EMC3/TMCO1 family protein [Candidatus Harpocratesius sp.]